MITVKKVWGTELWLYNGPDYCMKELRLDPGFQSSVHMHKAKRETFLVVAGVVRLENFSNEGVLEESTMLFPGEFRTIEPGTYHRFASGHIDRPALIVEASTHHDDADVFRIQDSSKI